MLRYTALFFRSRYKDNNYYVSSHILYQAHEQLPICGHKYALINGKTFFISLIERCKIM